MKQVSVCEAVAVGLWLIGLGLVIADVIFANHNDHGLGPLGVVLAIGGATLNVKAWMCHLLEREINAFELGRDSVRTLRR